MKQWSAFCLEEPVAVARKLLGTHLVGETAGGSVSGMIVEVEAYGGFSDAGSHISRGVTERTKIMLDTPGLAYVYIIYGVHHCLNVVAHSMGQAGAVLIRAVEPLTGIEVMQRRRGVDAIRSLCSGPGKLCQAFGITKDHNGHFLGEQPVYITFERKVDTEQIVAVPRVNIDYAGEAKHWPWRFYIKENAYVSRK